MLVCEDVSASLLQDFDFHHHRPNMVSMVMSKGPQLCSSPQLVSQHDEVGCVGVRDDVRDEGVWMGA